MMKFTLLLIGSLVTIWGRTCPQYEATMKPTARPPKISPVVIARKRGSPTDARKSTVAQKHRSLKTGPRLRHHPSRELATTSSDLVVACFAPAVF